MRDMERGAGYGAHRRMRVTIQYRPARNAALPTRDVRRDSGIHREDRAYVISLHNQHYVSCRAQMATYGRAFREHKG